MIDGEIDKLLSWLLDGANFELPSYRELPTVPLYMEQVITYINKTLTPLLPEDSNALTSFMVNNYVKAKIIKEPDKKKYSEEHLGYLLAICLLKRTLSMSELSLLIRLDGDISSDKSTLYTFFRSMLKDITKDVSEKITFHVNDFNSNLGKLNLNDPVKVSQYQADSLALLALRLSIKASVYSLISSKILSSVSSILADMPLPEENAKLSKKEIKRAEKNAISEAERVARYIEKGNKKRLEKEEKVRSLAKEKSNNKGKDIKNKKGNKKK